MLPLVVLGIATTSALVASSVLRGRSPKSDRPPGDVLDIDRGDRNDIDVGPPDDGNLSTAELAAMVGAPAIWQDVFSLISHGESNDRDDVARGVKYGAPDWAHVNVDDDDARAAATSYDRNVEWLRPCWTRTVYVFGSAGRFQMFPAAALAAFRNDPQLRCVHPWALFDGRASMICAAWMAYRLQQWKNYRHTVLSMRAAWANPSTMHKPTQQRHDKWAGHAQEIGLGASFVDRELPDWEPAPASKLWDSIMGLDSEWLPEQKRNAA